MYILFAPSQSKSSDGYAPPFTKDSLSFAEFFPHRQKVLKLYDEFIYSQSLDDIASWFGIKDKTKAKNYIAALSTLHTTKAIQRYTGIAYKAIDYDNLDQDSQTFLDDHVMIFSDLFGAILAKDFIPDYRYKQGAKLPGIDVAKHYKTCMSDILHIALGSEVLDLRARYYEKFYNPTANTITYKFLKHGKTISHWAKLYRGKLLRDIAIQKVSNFDQLLKFKVSYLKTVDIQTTKNIKTIVVDIVDTKSEANICETTT